MSSRAAHFDSLSDGRIGCRLCPHECTIKPGRLGVCRTRRNEDGVLRVLTYGRLKAVAVDPIEKKPLSHYRPGSTTFSVASYGCNLSCPFCQNHGLSQALRDDEAGQAEIGRVWSPQDVVNAAIEQQCKSISFTYSEPILSFEFARDVAALAAPEGIEIVFVTNGQVNPEPAHELSEFLSAANMDLKCFSREEYQSVLGGNLDAVTSAIGILQDRGVWIEVTTLVIPGFNDSDSQLGDVARFLVQVDPAIPWHVSRFHPDYKWLDRSPTSRETLERARQIGHEAGLRYVYSGNLPGHDGEKTLCPRCGEIVVDRFGYHVRSIRTTEGRCDTCGEPIAGVGLP